MHAWSQWAGEEETYVYPSWVSVHLKDTPDISSSNEGCHTVTLEGHSGW